MRTTVNIDPELLHMARNGLGTEGVSETINAALADVARRTRLREFDVRMFDVSDEDLADSRRDRLATESP